MGEPRLEALAVLRRAAEAGAGRHAEHHRHRHRAAEHVAQFRRLIDDLLHRQHREIAELEFVDRPHAGQRRADREPRAAEFGDRRVEHAVGAVALDKVARHLERAAVEADVLAHQEHAGVGVHRQRQRLAGWPRHK